MTRASRTVLRHRRALRRLVTLRGPVLLRLREFRLYVRLDDWVIGARSARRRVFEPYVAGVFRNRLRPGMQVIDLGAKIGYYAMLAAARVGPTGRVSAFEPDPANAELLARSAAANGFGNIELFNCAAAAATGVVELATDKRNGRQTGARRVQAVALDSLLGPGHRVELIRMELEGAEGLALDGMERLLRARRPTLICEFSPPALRAVSRIEPEAFLERLRELGYELLVIDRAMGLSPRPESNAAVMAHFARAASQRLNLLASPKKPLLTRRTL